LQRLRIIFAGSGEFGLPTLRGLLAAGHELVLVVSQPDRPAGRGRSLTPTPVARESLDRNLPLLRTDQVNSQALPAADLMVVIAFGQKISQDMANRPHLGSVNLHASLLPRYRGAAPINWAICRGETQTGNSVIRLADRMDSGAVLGQSQVPIGPTETAGELHDRLAEDGRPLVLRVAEELATGRAVETPQDESQATPAPKLARDAARIDWNRPAVDVARLICGMSPWPGCRAAIVDASGSPAGRVTLIRADTVTGSRGAPACIDAEGDVVAAGGSVRILELQPEGKRAMTLSAYRNGHRWEAGMRLESLT
jgi:methionyl-tRNA formyltransferase